MTIHRIIETRTIGRGAQGELVMDEPGAEAHARLALRADGSLWLLGEAERPCFVDRGSGWAGAVRLCLCAGDRFRLGARELTVGELCGLAGLDPGEVTEAAPIASNIPGMAAPGPLLLRAEAMARARRDPATGQIEGFE